MMYYERGLLAMSRQNRVLLTRVRRVLETTQYACLAINDQGQPWSSPVYFAFDDGLYLYFASSLDSRHTMAILGNPNVTAVVYNANPVLEKHESVVIDGDAFVIDELQIGKVVALLSSRQGSAAPLENAPNAADETYSEDSIVRLFKVVPRRVFIVEEGRRLGGRVTEVFLVRKQVRIHAPGK